MPLTAFAADPGGPLPEALDRRRRPGAGRPVGGRYGDSFVQRSSDFGNRPDRWDAAGNDPAVEIFRWTQVEALPKWRSRCRAGRSWKGSAAPVTYPGFSPQPKRDIDLLKKHGETENFSWLVVSTPLNNISQLGLLFHISGK